MSNLVSVMKGASFEGAIRVADAGVCGMITLRGDLASDALSGALQACLGAAVPAQRKVVATAEGAVLWMSPDELMILCAYEAADALAEQLSAALAGAHHLCVNVSDARALFTLEGEGAAIREVLAKGAPVDLRESSLGVGEIRRSRLGQLAVAFWFAEGGKAHLICFRSVGAHVYDWLTTAAVKDTLPGVL